MQLMLEAESLENLTDTVIAKRKKMKRKINEIFCHHINEELYSNAFFSIQFILNNKINKFSF